MTTFGGLRYDFQADGAYVLTQSTVPGDTFQIQMQTAPFWANNAASLTTAVAAQVGSDVIAFDASAADPVLVDGVADASLSSSGQIQTFAAGKLIEESPTTFQVDWNSGETLTVDDEGVYFNTGVTLGSADGPGAVRGLLGPDAGQADDISLPDGTVLSSPSPQQLLGEYAQAWSVTDADSLFGPIAPPAGSLDIASGQTVSLGAKSSYHVVFESEVGEKSGSRSSLILTHAQDFAGSIAGLDANDSIDLFDFSAARSSIAFISGTGAAGSYTDVTITENDSAGLRSSTLLLLNDVAGQYGLAASDYSLTSDLSASGGTLLQLAKHG